MTSIEWLKKELENYGSPSHLNLDWSTFDELIEQAKKMHKQEVTNCNHLEISDVEIEEAADKYVAEDEFNRLLKDFEEGAKWYREKLKQNSC